VKTRFFGMLFAGLVLLASCSQASDPTSTPTGPAEVVQSTAAAEPTDGPPTNTPQPEIVATTVGATDTPQEESAATDVSPTSTRVPEPTATAIPSTDTPQSEPTATTTVEPSATPIPCSGMLTSPNQEGPFYSAGSPERSSLIEEGMEGVPVLIVGRVFDQDCNPITGAKLDFWLADVNGEYDNVGYTLRGHLFTDANGNYALESIEPTPYTGRPPHIHAKVFAPDGRELLITQMYFAGSEGSSDVTASPDLLVNYLEPDENGRQQVLFNFVVQN
jgi:protocatechuate 3,4-dioxygenase beta subunit